MAELDQVLDRFDVLWQSEDRSPVLDAFVRELTLSEDQRTKALPELIAIDMEYRWRSASAAMDPEKTETAALAKAAQEDTIPELLKPRPVIEDYVRQWPEILQDGGVPVSLIAEEFRIRHRWGDRPDINEFVRRFGERSGLDQALTEIRRELISDGGSSVPATPTEFSDNERFPDHRESAQTLPDLSALKRYRILKTLGRGGMGDVFLAEDTQLDREVALKTPHFLQGQTLRDRFINEAKAAAMLRHPGICPVFDVGEVDGHPFLTMAYIGGQTIRERWAKPVRPPVVETVSFLARIASAMGVAHEAGIVHRDLKPANVMIEPDGNPVIMDFGLACRAELPADQRITKTGDAFGSPAYMSPEQVDGPASQVGPASDIYSLGVMLYEGLTGELPFTGSVTSMLVKIATEAPPPPSQLRRDVGPELDQLCLQMLAKHPAERPETMAEVARRLAAIEQRAATGDQPRSTAELQSPRRRNPVLIAALLAPIVLLLGLIIFNVQTPYGPVRIEVAEEFADQIKVRVLQGGELVEVADSTSGWSLSLQEGNYEFELGRGGEQFEIEPKRVEVTQGNEAVVSIVLPPRSHEESAIDRQVDESSGGSTFQTVDATPNNHSPALRFDGIDDYVQLPFAYDGSHPLTVEVWVTPTTLDTNRTRQNIVADESISRTVDDPAGFHLTLFNDLNWAKDETRRWVGYIGKSKSRTRPPLIGPRAILNRRVHLAMQVGNPDAELYVDGQPVAHLNRVRSYKPSVEKIRLGTDYPYEAKPGEFIVDPFKGLIHSVRFSTRLRYNGRFEPQRDFETDADTLALYRFDDGNGFTLKDSSGNNHHGEIIGAKWVEVPRVSRENAASQPAKPSEQGVASEVRMLGQLNTARYQEGAWPSADGLRLYYEQDGIQLATRSAPVYAFKHVRQVASGRHPTLSGDELTLICLNSSKQLCESRRPDRDSEFTDPVSIESLADQESVKSPCLSNDGLQLVFQRGSMPNIEFAITRRASLDAPWETPEPLAHLNQRERGESPTWPCLSEDGLTLWYAHGGDAEAEVWFARRSSADSPFEFFAPVIHEGKPLMGRSPRYCAATGELFFSVFSGQSTWYLAVIEVSIGDSAASNQ